MHTIPEIDEIAKRATERIAKEFAESGFANPPVVTHGIARAVLEAAQQSVQATGLSPTFQLRCVHGFVACGDCGTAQSPRA